MPDRPVPLAPWKRTRALLAATLAVIGLGLLAPSLGLGQQNIPGVAPLRKKIDLLKTEPFDRITLPDNSVWEIEPLSPRPLPPLDTKKQREKKIREANAIPAEGNIGLVGEKSKIQDKAEIAKEEEERESLIIHLMDAEVRDYRVKRENIKTVEYFEDMLIAEADRLITAKEFSRAFELLLIVEQRQPGWKGLAETTNRLLYEEGSEALSNLDGEKGLRLLFELYARKPDFPGLGDRLASSFSKRIDTAFRVGNYPRSRQILHEFASILPDHTLVKEATNRFRNRTKDLIEKSKDAKPSEKVDLLIDAARTWPTYEGLEDAFKDGFRNEPVLDVAVTDVANPIGPWPGTPALSRISRLLYMPLLAADDESGLKGNRTDQLLAGLETGELGRSLRIQVKDGIKWSDGTRNVSAIDVARALADRAQPSSPAYNARWADLLDSIKPVDETQVEVVLSRPVMKPEAWLLTPIGPAHASADGWVAVAGQDRRPVGDGMFKWVAGSPTSTQFQNLAAPVAPGTRVKRLREKRFNSPEEAQAAFLAGDVTMLEHVPTDQVEDYRKKPDVKVGTYSLPLMQFLAVDGRNGVLRSRSLRRAISLSIDRKTLLEETVLRRKPDEKNVVSDGPFPKGSYMDAPDVPAYDYDPLLGKMLVAAARKELGGGTWDRLKLEYPATPEARAVVPKIIEALTLVGIEIQGIERNESELESELKAGRRFDLAFRSLRFSEPTVQAGPLLCPAYDAPPQADGLGAITSPRIMQLLLQYDRTPEATTSRALLTQIDREARDELPIIPLWQLEDHYAWRGRLKGPAESQADLYENIQKWEIEPWFARDPW